GLIANAAQVGGKIGDNLRAALETLPLSRQLVTIRTDVPLDLAPTDLVLRERDIERLREMYTRYGFNSALKELDAADATAAAVAATGVTESAPARPAPDAPEKGTPSATAPIPASAPIGASGDYELVTDTARLEHWIERLRSADLIAFDTETTSTDPM